MKKILTTMLVMSIVININATDTTKQVAQNQNEFAYNLYAQLKIHRSSNNIFFSPYSIHSVVGMEYAGARNKT